mmetsp:Transcript_88056/g.188978  ORF Transcript_88056/g.188978 Transcript_88056/m.188978 type:complete len:254 (-) Transcript_88056:21-782(-)
MPGGLTGLDASLLDVEGHPWHLPAAHLRSANATHFADLQEYAASMQKDIDQLSSQWATGLSKVSNQYERGRAIRASMDSAWKRNTNVEACQQLRTALEKATAAKRFCEEAQSSAQNGLPALFRKRAKDPERFKGLNYGRGIRGCAEAGKEDGSLSAVPCSCPSGNEATGCEDAQDGKGHQLKCTLMLDHAIHTLGVADFFKPGGMCNEVGEAAWNQAVVPPSVFGELKSASCGAMLSSFFPPATARRRSAEGE